jgi:hypothetical protein
MFGRKRRQRHEELVRVEESLYWHAASWLSRVSHDPVEWFASPDRQSVGVVMPEFTYHLASLAEQGNVVDGRDGPHFSFVSPASGVRPGGIVVPTPCDVTVVNVVHDETEEVIVSATASVSDVPSKLRLPHEALPERPFRLEIHGGWSDSAIDETLSRWAKVNASRAVGFRNTAVLVETAFDDAGMMIDPDPAGDEVFDAGDEVTLGWDDVDRLMAVGVDAAAGICRSIKAAVSAIRGQVHT